MKLKFVAVAMLVGFAAWASEQWVCMVSATSPTPAHTGDAGKNLDAGSGNCSWVEGSVIRVQCDSAVYTCAGGNDPRANVGCTKVAVGDPYTVDLTASEKAISILPVSGTSTCHFFKDMK